MSCSFEWSDELYHYGRKGMKWYQHIFGSIKTGAQRVASAISKHREEKQRKKIDKKAARGNKKAIRKKLSMMSKEEIEEAIKKLNIDNQYIEAVKKNKPSTMKAGKEVVSNILKSSAQNIGTQLVTYGLGTAVNKILGTNAVNPKKGQKDK